MKEAFGNTLDSLHHLSEVSVDCVPKDIEAYMFIN